MGRFPKIRIQCVAISKEGWKLYSRQKNPHMKKQALSRRAKPLGEARSPCPSSSSHLPK